MLTFDPGGQSHVSCTFVLHQIRSSKLSAERPSCAELLCAFNKLGTLQTQTQADQRRSRQSLPTVDIAFPHLARRASYSVPE
jgi:hypothetical protein